MDEIEREIERILRNQDRRVSEDTRKVLKLLDQTRREILADTASTPWEVYYLPRLQKAVEDQMLAFVNQARELMGEGQISSWTAGGAVVDHVLSAAAIEVGMPFIPTSLLSQLKSFSAKKLEDRLLPDVLEKINSELTLGMIGRKTPYEVAQAIGQSLDDPGIFKSTAARAEVIVREEYGRTFSAARQERMRQAAEKVPGLKKIWRHAGHPKVPRESHVEANGQIRDVNEPFIIAGESLMYPRDPAGAPWNTINCGCQSLPYKEEWGIREAAISFKEEYIYS